MRILALVSMTLVQLRIADRPSATSACSDAEECLAIDPGEQLELGTVPITEQQTVIKIE